MKWCHLVLTEGLAVKKKKMELSPSSDEVQQVLPAFADFAEFVLDVWGLAVLTGPGQTLPHHLQLLLVLLSHTNLFLVVLRSRAGVRTGTLNFRQINLKTLPCEASLSSLRCWCLHSERPCSPSVWATHTAPCSSHWTRPTHLTSRSPAAVAGKAGEEKSVRR